MPQAPGISSFIPGTTLQFAWDSTSLGLLKTCPRKYQYTVIEGWRRSASTSSVHLDFGSWYHKALETYDKLRAEDQSHEDSLREVTRQALIWTWVDGKPWESGHNTKTRGTLIRTIVWYLDQFATDPAETVILADGKPAVELSFRMETEWWPNRPLEGRHNEPSPYLLCGHLDRVVTYCGDNYVIDRKTTSTALSPYYFDGYNPDNQMSLYTMASKVIYGTPVKGVIIDAAQIMVGFSRFERGFTHRTEAQTLEFLQTTEFWLRRAEDYAAADFWPMNDTACGMYGGCVFRRICSKDPSMRETFLRNDFVARNFWNPLEVR